MLCDISKLFLRFGRSERGNVLIIVAFAAVIMVSFIGLAIDMSRTNIAKQNQQNSVDIAERAAKNYCLNDTTAKASQPAMQTCITTQVNKYFQANASKNIAGSNVGVNPLITVFDQNTNVPTTTATSQISSAIIQATIDKCAGLTGNALTTCQNSADYQINGSTKSVALATNLVTGASNTAWSGVCGGLVNNLGTCVIGKPSSTIVSDTTYSWNCSGNNGGAAAPCNAVNNNADNGACGDPSTITAGACNSGTVSGFSTQSSNASFSTSWTCNGSNGGSDANCSKTFCTAPASTQQTCAAVHGSGYAPKTGYSDPAVITSYYCDASGIVQSNPTDNCTALSQCVPYSQTSNSTCSNSTTYYNCDPNNPYNAATTGNCQYKNAPMNAANNGNCGTVETPSALSCNSLVLSCDAISKNGTCPSNDNTGSITETFSCTTNFNSLLSYIQASLNYPDGFILYYTTFDKNNGYDTISYLKSSYMLGSNKAITKAEQNILNISSTNDNNKSQINSMIDIIENIYPTPAAPTTKTPKKFHDKDLYNNLLSYSNNLVFENGQTIDFNTSKLFSYIFMVRANDYMTNYLTENPWNIVSNTCACNNNHQTNSYPCSANTTFTQDQNGNPFTSGAGTYGTITTDLDLCTAKETVTSQNCTACGNMTFNYWVRTSHNALGFSSNDPALDLQDTNWNPYEIPGGVNCTDGGLHMQSWNDVGIESGKINGCMNYSGESSWSDSAFGGGTINKGTTGSYFPFTTMYKSTAGIISAYKKAKKKNNSIDGNDAQEVAQCPTNGTPLPDGSTSQFFTLMEHNIISPLKVNLAGKDAVLNSERSIQFSMTQKNGGSKIYNTYGSLNADEAWLMVDKDGTGLIKNGVVNGDDFFTDHEGVKNDAYHDLITQFGSFVKKDENGHSYIELSKKSAVEHQSHDAQIAGQKLGSVIPVDPSFDLKLLDANNKTLYASDYFDRIYVDYININISDKDMHNLILEVAPVRTLDGKYHLSVDQWFVPK